MAIVPIIRCSRIKISIEFYTRVLDFQWVDDGMDPEETRRSRKL